MRHLPPPETAPVTDDRITPPGAITRRAMGVGLAGFGVSAVMGRVRADAVRTIRIGYLQSLTPLAIGRVRGSIEPALRAKGYAVEWSGPFAAFAPAVEALTPGSIDVTIGSATSAVSAMVAEAPFKIIAYAPPAQDSEGLLARPESGITSISDLVGRKVAVNRGGTGEYLLAKGLAAHGIPWSKVQKLYLGPADAAYAFSTGNIDAWAVWDPYVAIAQVRDKARVLAWSRDLGSENATIIVVRNALLEHEPAAVHAVYDALITENKWDIAHVPEVAELWGKDIKVDPAIVDVMAQRHPFVYGPADTVATASLDHVAEWFAAQKIIPTKPDVSAFVFDVTRRSPA